MKDMKFISALVVEPPPSFTLRHIYGRADGLLQIGGSRSNAPRLICGTSVSARAFIFIKTARLKPLVETRVTMPRADR